MDGNSRFLLENDQPYGMLPMKMVRLSLFDAIVACERNN